MLFFVTSNMIKHAQTGIGIVIAFSSSAYVLNYIINDNERINKINATKANTNKNREIY
jgi:hypothetical protein